MSVAAIQSGLAGYQSQVQRLEQTAQRVAERPLDRLPDNVVDLRTSELGAKANIAVVKAADETLGTLLDLFA